MKRRDLNPRVLPFRRVPMNQQNRFHMISFPAHSLTFSSKSHSKILEATISVGRIGAVYRGRSAPRASNHETSMLTVDKRQVSLYGGL